MGRTMLSIALLVLMASLATCQIGDNVDMDIDMKNIAVHSSTAVDGDDNDIDVEASDSDSNSDDAGDADADNDDDVDDGEDTAKEGYGYKQPKKKVYVPIYVPDQEKKKMKIISVDKGFYVQGGMQLFGKFKSLKHCMKACAVTPTCFQGDYNPWLHKCYQHTNLTACGTMKSHPQFIHFSKVPCSITDAPLGNIVMGASMSGGVEEKGIDSLSQCIKKCTQSGNGIPATVISTKSASTPSTLGRLSLAIASDVRQTCFAVEFDFATCQCFFFQQNLNEYNTASSLLVLLHCALGRPRKFGNSQGLRPNPTVVHMTFCPRPVAV